MKILLSGGWGYGNIGDDAILLASISLIKERYPHAHISITSYNPDYTRKVIGGRYIVYPSVHRKVFGDSAYKFLRVEGYVFNDVSYPFWIRRILGRIRRLCPQKDIQQRVNRFFANKGHEPFADEFQGIDIFIMTGGGYFNSWEESTISRILELEACKMYNVKSVICGQTLGPFNIAEDLYARLKKSLSAVSSIYVRDIESLQDLKMMNFTGILAPDIALCQAITPNEEKQKLVIVPAEFPRKSMGNFIDTLSRFINDNALSSSIVVTRKYIADIACAKEFYKELRKKCNMVDVKLIIPEVFADIDKELAACKYVISRNLHGLILAWRSGARCLCLNNERKFLSFMNQIGDPDSIIDPLTITQSDLTNHLERLKQQKVNNSARLTLANEVRSAFYTCIQ